jgi:hypothetical protein
VTSFVVVLTIIGSTSDLSPPKPTGRGAMCDYRGAGGSGDSVWTALPSNHIYESVSV